MNYAALGQGSTPWSILTALLVGWLAGSLLTPFILAFGLSAMDYRRSGAPLRSGAELSNLAPAIFQVIFIAGLGSLPFMVVVGGPTLFFMSRSGRRGSAIVIASAGVGALAAVLFATVSGVISAWHARTPDIESEVPFALLAAVYGGISGFLFHEDA